MKKIKTIIGWGPIDYVTIHNVPIRYSNKHGEILDISPKEIERKIAIALIENKIPIYGQELKLIKSAINLSFEDISKELGISKNSLVSWCKKESQRLSMVYEMAIRVLAADILGIELLGTLKDLKAKETRKNIDVEAA